MVDHFNLVSAWIQEHTTRIILKQFVHICVILQSLSTLLWFNQGYQTESLVRGWGLDLAAGPDPYGLNLTAGWGHSPDIRGKAPHKACKKPIQCHEAPLISRLEVVASRLAGGDFQVPFLKELAADSVPMNKFLI